MPQPPVGKDVSAAQAGKQEKAGEKGASAAKPGAKASADWDATVSDASKAAKDAGKAGKAFLSSLGTTFSKMNNKTKAVLGGAVAVVVVAIVAFVLIANGGPSDAQIKADIEKSSSLSIVPSVYSSKQVLKITSISDIQRNKEQVPDYYKGFIGDEMINVTAKVHASSGAVDAEGNATVTYVKQNDKWTSYGASVSDATYKATAGVDKSLVEEQASSILNEANINDIKDYRDLLDTIKPKISEVQFDKDKQTSNVNLVYEKKTSYIDFKATIVAQFTFAKDHWDLASATLDKNATKVSYDQLVGTWTGKFLKQDAQSGKCYGAQGKEFKLVIKSIDPESLKVEGTYSGTAHYHGPLGSDANSTDGDEQVTDQPFTATLQQRSHWDSTFTDKSIGADASTEENSKGYLTLSFDFGSNGAQDVAQASLKTTANYKMDAVFSILDLTTNYTDVYSLTKAK